MEAEQKERPGQLDKVRAFFEMLYDRKITQSYDRIIPVIGDEGKGKSTAMLQMGWIYQDVRGLEPSSDSVHDTIVWGGRENFARRMSTAEPRSLIMLHDAAHVLHKQEAYDPEQREILKDTLDSRMKEFVILLGYQDWDLVPSMLQDRRAKNAFYIPQRGTIHGFSRESMDHRQEYGEWPEPDLSDTFPPLDGTELYDRFKRKDLQIKEERMSPEEDDEKEPKTNRELAEHILETGVDQFISIHGAHKTKYVDKDLIRDYWDLSHSDAKTVTKMVEREVTLNEEEE